MSKILLCLALLAAFSFATSEAHRRRPFRGCNISYENEEACTADNSYPNPRRFGGGNRPLITTDSYGRVCRCVDPNWKRCADERKNCVEITTATTTTAGSTVSASSSSSTRSST